MLDGDPFKLYYSWAEWRVGALDESDWEAKVEATRRQLINGDYGIADLVLYSDPGEVELRRRKKADRTRSRRSFERHTAMRPYFAQWYEAVSTLDPSRVVWEHPADGLSEDLLALGRRRSRSDPELFDRLLARLPTRA